MSNGTVNARRINLDTDSLKREPCVSSALEPETAGVCITGVTPLPQVGWCTSDEVAAALQLEEPSFRRLVRAHKLPHKRLGRAMILWVPDLYEAFPDGTFGSPEEVPR
jgi:hypothetical protein